MHAPPVLSVLSRVLLVVVGGAVAVLLLEGALRLVATGYGPRERVAMSGSSSRATILALGDSHTYGIFFEEHEAYPGQIGRILEEWHPGGYEVVNLGLPGTNSTELVDSLPAWLDHFRPEVVLVCVGVNNTWNTSGVFRSLRVARLLRLVLSVYKGDEQFPHLTRPAIARELVDEGRSGERYHDAESGELLIAHRGNIHQWSRSLAEARSVLGRDLQRMRELTVAAGAKLVLLTYAAFPLPQTGARFSESHAMNEEMRRFAQTHSVAIVDVRNRFSELLRSGVPRTAYFWREDDGHPNFRGYLEIARLVADQLAPAGAEAPAQEEP